MTFRIQDLAGLLLCLVILGSCVPPRQATQAAKPTLTITVNGTQYHSVEAATEALRNMHVRQLAAVQPFPDRLGGRLRVVLADTDRLRPFVQQRNAQANIKIDAATTYLLNDYVDVQESFAEALKRSNLFDAVDVVVQNDTEDPPFDGYDYLVFFQVGTVGPNHTGLWYARWQVRRAPNRATELATVDAGTPELERTLSWVKSVRSAAVTLGGGPATAVAAGRAASGGAPNAVLTGIVVSAQGDIVTNDHGVKSCGKVEVRVGHTSRPATVVAHDQQNDLALLHVEHSFSAVASFREGAQIRPGDSVIAVGYPLGQVLSSDAIVTTGSVSALAGMRDDTRFLQFTAPIQQGNSGGPLVDYSGHVTGMVTSKLSALLVAMVTGDIPQNVNFALKSLVVRNFLDGNAVTYHTATSAGEDRPAEIAERVKQFTVLVRCFK
jgi:S1-C subfamily serine protease